MEDQLVVVDITWYGDGIFKLSLDRGELSFVTGDCVALYNADGSTSRPYSVASGPDDPNLQFIIRRMAGGEVSDYLAQLKVGDRVKVSPPFGWFRPGDPSIEAPFVFIATGTGISPFMSHFRSRPERPPLALLYGVREIEDAVEREWLATQCDVQLALSRSEVEGHHHGRVTDLVKAMTLDTSCHFFLCGLDSMIDEVTCHLEASGVPINQIHRECFFNAEYD